MIGRQLGNYTILSQLGQGGMASVFLAEQAGLGRRVALKLLQPYLAADPVVVERFQREAKIAANLHHAHIVTIYDVGDIDGTYFIAMRFIEGENLGQLLQREGPLPPARTLALVEQVADALDHAHSRNILHRDIKPANVMVERGDVVTLTDFGIARAGESTHLTSVNMVVGTPEYMSPEQASGRDTDARSDLYALGVLLFEALGGRTPFSGASTPSVLYQHVHQPPPPISQLRPDLPLALNDVLAKALAKDPSARYQNGRELVAAMRRALNQAPPAFTGPPSQPGVTGPTAPDPARGFGGPTVGPGAWAGAPQRPPTPPQPGAVPPPPGASMPSGVLPTAWQTQGPPGPTERAGTPPPTGWQPGHTTPAPAAWPPGQTPAPPTAWPPGQTPPPPTARAPGQPAPPQAPRQPTPPPGVGRPPGPAPTGPVTRVMIPPVPGTSPPGGYAPGFAGQPPMPPAGGKPRSPIWIVGPIIGAIALLAIGVLLGSQTGLFGGSATPTPTAVAAKPTTAPVAEATSTSPPLIAPTSTPAATQVAKVEATQPPTVAPTAPPTAAPKPTEPPPAPKPTNPPVAKPTAPPPPAGPTPPQRPTAVPAPTAVIAAGQGRDPCPEPNNAMQSACYLGPGAPALGFISSANDEDIYRIEVLDFNTTVHVDLGPMPAPYVVALGDWNGKVIATSSPGGNGQVLETTAPLPGAYFIRVRSANGAFNAARPYQLSRILTYLNTNVSGTKIPDIIWANDFRAGDNAAKSEQTPYAYHIVEEGRYMIQMKVRGIGRDRNPSEAWWTGLGPELSDFTMTVDASIIEGSEAGASIFFRYADNKNTYQLGIDPKTGAAQLWKILNGEINGSGWKKSPKIDTSGGINRIVVRAVQDSIQVNINGEDLISLRDNSLRKGKIGIGAMTYGDPSTVAFDNVIITTPTEAGRR